MYENLFVQVRLTIGIEVADFCMILLECCISIHNSIKLPGLRYIYGLPIPTMRDSEAIEKKHLIKSTNTDPDYNLHYAVGI